jgi:HEPN domain-containing protein
MATKIADHWLYRLTPDEWLRAAENELQRAEQALSAKRQREGVATARRAAGMAWNAVLATGEATLAEAVGEGPYGRSYMEHLAALAKDAAVPEGVRRAAAELVAAPLNPVVVQIGKGDARLAGAAREIVEHAKERVAPSVRA